MSYNYAELLENSYQKEREVADCPPRSRLEFLSENIFRFATYESGAAELFASKAVEVCEAISKRQTYSYYHTDQSTAQWFLLMCNMPFFAVRITWGTSIRGAMWAVGDKPLAVSGVWDGWDPVQQLEFQIDEAWSAFIQSVIEFSRKQ